MVEYIRPGIEYPLLTVIQDFLQGDRAFEALPVEELVQLAVRWPETLSDGRRQRLVVKPEVHEVWSRHSPERSRIQAIMALARLALRDPDAVESCKAVLNEPANRMLRDFVGAFSFFGFASLLFHGDAEGLRLANLILESWSELEREDLIRWLRA